jgi:hypothetical protein
MKKIMLVWLGGIFMSLLLGCSSVKVDMYKGEKPEFDFFNFFQGELTAEGFFQDRKGQIVKRIFCDMKGRMEGDWLIVDELFTYSDNTKETRTWKFKKGSDGRILEATAGDVKEVLKIDSAGYAFNMRYILNLKVGDSTYAMKMDDWMYRMNDRMVINKTKMSKLGIELGEVTLMIQKK